MTLSEALKEASSRVDHNAQTLEAIELRHSTFIQGPIRAVSYPNPVDITLEADAPADAGQTVTFASVAFRAKQPDLSSDPDARAQIAIDGLVATVQPFVAQANKTGEPILATLRFYHFNTDGDVVGEMVDRHQLEWLNMASDALTTQMTFGYVNGANQKVPNENYTAESNPGLP